MMKLYELFKYLVNPNDDICSNDQKNKIKNYLENYEKKIGKNISSGAFGYFNKNGELIITSKDKNFNTYLINFTS